MEKVESRLEPRQKVRKYSSRNRLHRRMLALNPIFGDFMTGSKYGDSENFHCRVCRRDLAMGSHKASEFTRHFGSAKHWRQDVVYRVHLGLPIFHKLIEPKELSESQRTEFQVQPFVDLSGEFRGSLYCSS